MGSRGSKIKSILFERSRSNVKYVKVREKNVPSLSCDGLKMSQKVHH